MTAGTTAYADETMTIFPLTQFEKDADPTDRGMTDEERYAQLESPSTIVVRVGFMARVAEYPYKGEAKPGCGSKLVAKTHRGLEMVEMLTTTCPNAGCGKSVTRSEMLEYIKGSGGKDYPFRTDGRIVRVATIEDMNEWSAVKSTCLENVKIVKRMVAGRGLEMSVVEVEPILGQEQLTVYYMSDDRVDFRELIKDLASEFGTRIEMRQVGGRDEARLTADYEKCGQHCCCKNFLKVLKPISMRAAKTQKATLDPLKISGRCGRLMCCLRYEDETYDDLKKRLPHRKTRVGTPDGPGIVLDSKILVQLVLVKLEEDGRQVAVPVEELCDPDKCPVKAPEPDPFRGLGGPAVEERTDDQKRNRRSKKTRTDRQAEHKAIAKDEANGGTTAPETRDRVKPETGDSETTGPKKKRRRRRKSSAGNEGGGSSATPDASDQNPRAKADPADGGQPEAGSVGPKKKRRRRRRRSGGGGATPPGGESNN